MYISEQARKLDPTEAQNLHETTNTIDDRGADTWADFLATFGTWQDSRSVEETLNDIHQGRRSKSVPAHESGNLLIQLPLTCGLKSDVLLLITP